MHGFIPTPRPSSCNSRTVYSRLAYAFAPQGQARSEREVGITTHVWHCERASGPIFPAGRHAAPALPVLSARLPVAHICKHAMLNSGIKRLNLLHLLILADGSSLSKLTGVGAWIKSNKAVVLADTDVLHGEGGLPSAHKPHFVPAASQTPVVVAQHILATSSTSQAGMLKVQLSPGILQHSALVPRSPRQCPGLSSAQPSASLLTCSCQGGADLQQRTRSPLPVWTGLKLR